MKSPVFVLTSKELIAETSEFKHHMLFIVDCSWKRGGMYGMENVDLLDKLLQDDLCFLTIINEVIDDSVECRMFSCLDNYT